MNIPSMFYSLFYVSSQRCLFSTPFKACLLNSTRAEPSQRSSERQLGLCNQFENRAKKQLEVCKEDLKVCACANYLARLCNSWSKVFTLAHRPALQSGEMFSVCRIECAVTLSTAVLVAAAAAEVAGEAGTQCPLDLGPDKIARAE